MHLLMNFKSHIILEMKAESYVTPLIQLQKQRDRREKMVYQKKNHLYHRQTWTHGFCPHHKPKMSKSSRLYLEELIWKLPLIKNKLDVHVLALSLVIRCRVGTCFANTHLKCIPFPKINTEMTYLSITATRNQMRSYAEAGWSLAYWR